MFNSFHTCYLIFCQNCISHFGLENCSKLWCSDYWEMHYRVKNLTWTFLLMPPSPRQKRNYLFPADSIFRKSISLSRRGRENYGNGFFNPFSANFTKWSNTLKQFVGNLPTNCLSVFDHFVELALKGLIIFTKISSKLDKVYSKLVKSTLTKDFEQSK